jgi:YD repeat-containing protein
MTGRDQWTLRGPVHICDIQRTWYWRRCGAESCETEERSDRSVIEFRRDGSIARKSHHNPDGSEWTTIYEYNDARQLTATRTENGAELVQSQSYEYDDAGRLAQVIDHCQAGVDRVLETYEYDSAGRKKKISSAQYGLIVEGTNSGFSVPGAATVTTVYNERDQVINLLFHDQNAHLLSEVRFSYDPDGRLIEEMNTRFAELPSSEASSLNPAQLRSLSALFGGIEDPIRKTHRYDQLGRKVETRLYLGRFCESINTVTYNDHGDPIREVSEERRREYNMDDEGRLTDAPTSESLSRSEAHFRYEYDDRRNWVTKTIETRAGTEGELTPSSIERRAIRYFE